jgi:hypothetical protein
MQVKQEDIDRVAGVLVPTWQSVVAVAYHAKVTPKLALKITKYLRDSLRSVEIRDCRLDGHNPVYMVRPIASEPIMELRDD